MPSHRIRDPLHFRSHVPILLLLQAEPPCSIATLVGADNIDHARCQSSSEGSCQPSSSATARRRPSMREEKLRHSLRCELARCCKSLQLPCLRLREVNAGARSSAELNKGRVKSIYETPLMKLVFAPVSLWWPKNHRLIFACRVRFTDVSITHPQSKYVHS